MKNRYSNAPLDDLDGFQTPDLKQYLLAKELLLPVAERRLFTVSLMSIACLLVMLGLSIFVWGFKPDLLRLLRSDALTWVVSACVYTGILLLLIKWGFLVAQVNRIKFGDIQVMRCRLRSVQSPREDDTAYYLLCLELPNGMMHRGSFLANWKQIYGKQVKMFPEGIIVRARCGKMYGFVATE